MIEINEFTDYVAEEKDKILTLLFDRLRVGERL
jgi:hypothetical protein